MASRRGRPRGPTRAKEPEVKAYRHREKRKNNPEEGLATYLKEETVKKKYAYDPHLDPQLVWAGKAEHEQFELPVLPLHIHESAKPLTIVQSIQKKVTRQSKLFDDESFTIDKRTDFYQHEFPWANRLILGDSSLVANSLLTKELMGSTVQMIYLDPPYGIQFNSNFQPTVTQRDVRDGLDRFLTREPEQIKAYRDTWELGIHSYLTYVRDRLLLCRELLKDSGSIFVQIGMENVHRVRQVLDEIFGAENFVDQVVFRTTAGRGSKYLDQVHNILLWYAKDKEQLKFRRLLRPLPDYVEQAYDWVELPDGSGKPIDQMRGKPLAAGRRYALTDLTSQGESESGRYDFEFRGKVYRPRAGRHWSTTPEGMKHLVEANRIQQKGDNIFYKRYLDDYPFEALDDVWEDTAMGGYLKDEQKIYVVQTPTRVIERCILMSTDPSDLVFDPTCGSGTTAYCAEKWGRRWITCDTSRIAMTLARQRVLTATFLYYSLARPEEGVQSGFVYQTVPHVTLRSIAKEGRPIDEPLYDRPKVDQNVVRVSGPFTVEGIPAPSIDQELAEGGGPHEGTVKQGASDYISTMIEAVRKAGIVFPSGKKVRLDNLMSISSAGFLHAEGVASDESMRTAISFGPRYGPLGANQTESAIRTATANGYGMLILAGFSIDPASQSFVEKTPLKIKVHFAHINPDMELHDLLKQTQASQLFTVFGEPDVGIERDKDRKVIVTLKGVDSYDPTTGNIEQTDAAALPAWFLDEDYDGYSFNICQAFFPNGATKKDPWDKLERALHGTIDKDRIEAFRGKVSLPFDEGEYGTVAIKVVDPHGNEVVKIVKIGKK
jgi:adenine-specific DNA-methyltransferase